MISIQWRRSAPAIVGILCAMTFAEPASATEPVNPSRAAQPAGPSSPENAQKAATLYQKGVTAANEAKWLLAIEYFSASWDEYPHYQILLNLADAELMAKRYRDSAEHFDRALREYSSRLSPSDTTVIKRGLAEARSHVGVVTVQVNVRGAALKLDQKVVNPPAASGVLFVDPGSRTLEATHPGYIAARESLDVRAGQSYSLSLKLTRTAPTPGEETAPPAPAGGQPLATGLMIGGGIGAGLGAASGAVFLILSTGDAHRADDAQAALDKGKDSSRPTKSSECNAKNPFRANEACDALGLRERQQLFAGISAWSFVAGGLGLATAALGWGLDAAGDVRVTASASPSGGAVLMVGNW